MEGCHLYAKDRQSRFIMLNTFQMRLMGVTSVDEVLGKTDFDFFSRAYAERHFANEQELMRSGRPLVNHEESCVDHAGRISHLLTTKVPLKDSDGDVIGLVGMSLDITALREHEGRARASEQRLKAQHNLLRTVIDNIPHDIYAKDAHGQFLLANKHAAVTMKVHSPEAVVGKTDFDFYPAPQAAQFRADEEAVFSSGQPLLDKPEPKQTNNGDVLWITTTKVPLKDHDGKIVGIVGVGIDDTRRRIEEEKALRLEVQLRHSEKMKAIGQLAGGIAHDFNNQLAAIMGSADMIRVKSTDQEAIQHAELVLTAAKRSADLTEQLLSFARKGRYQSVPINIHKIIAEVTALLERSIDKRIRLVTQLKAPTAAIRGDPTQIQNALLNIAINARDAIRKEGTIVFCTEGAVLDEEQCRKHPQPIKPGRYVLIEIADTGVGMSAETKQHIFEPFFTTKPEGEGTGMGLAAVYGTVRSHCGSITFTSELGRGTQFKIWLPLTETVVEKAEAVKPADVLTKGSAHILVVDDEEVVRLTTQAILEHLGYTVTLCCDGKEAVDFYRKSAHPIDLVILDMIMPQASGLDVFTTLKQVNPAVGVILSSGFSPTQDVRKILETGGLLSSRNRSRSHSSPRSLPTR